MAFGCHQISLDFVGKAGGLGKPNAGPARDLLRDLDRLTKPTERNGGT
jgi:hypothetical protein